MPGGLPRSFLILGVLALLLAGAGYAWTFTPSYSLYHLRRALLTHDYTTFSYYVDVDSVLDHALEELTSERPRGEREESKPRGPLAKLLRKKFFKGLLNDDTTQGLAKAGLEMVIEQVVRDRSRPLPEIPAVAVVVALWQGRTEDGVASFPVKVKKGRIIEIRARQNSAGVWRVVEIENLPALLPGLKQLQKSSPPVNGDEQAEEHDIPS
ncbi:MAG: hypothetical protein HYZ50_25495 [Deltaproteobacteria bacterium]|nr:hypothetical protein [Deltaproteobacteria bacterium]